MRWRGIFIDRDGTINFDKGHVFRAKDFEYIPGALSALRRLSERGIKIHIVTNQAGIAKGLFTEADFAVLTGAMLNEMSAFGVNVADVLYCPHHPEATVPSYRMACHCRKPEVGLFRQVIQRDGLALGGLALIGDKNSDIEAGLRLGITTYLVETGYGAREKLNTKADYIVADLLAAVNHLLSGN